jgi:hypothetical protein
MQCYKCHHPLDASEKIYFKDSCPKCLTDLHACKMCRFFAPGRANDCLIPDVELVKDKEKYNFCEDFKPAIEGTSLKSSSISDIEKKLFG